MAMAMASQLASVVALSSAQQISASGTSSTITLPPLRTAMPAIECAKHAQKKATAHHNKTRPKKHQPYDKNRQGPTLYPAVAKAPPIWGFDNSDEIPDVWAPEPKVAKLGNLLDARKTGYPVELEKLGGWKTGYPIVVKTSTSTREIVWIHKQV